MSKSTPMVNLVIATIFTIFTISSASSNEPHIINFRFPNLYSESLTWDPSAQHFIVSSLRHTLLHSISDAAVVDTLISFPSSTSLYGRRLFLAPLPDPTSSASSAAGADDVAVDFSGNAYVTNAASNVIYKVKPDGEASVLSRSPAFTQYTVNRTTPYSSWGLNGIVYISTDYLLLVQSNTGKLFKVNVENGATRTVILNKDLTDADGIAVRRDGVVMVVSPHMAYFIKSDSNWSEGVIYDEIRLDPERFATSVTMGGEDRVYVLYGHVGEGMMGNAEREEFSSCR